MRVAALGCDLASSPPITTQQAGQKERDGGETRIVVVHPRAPPLGTVGSVRCCVAEGSVVCSCWLPLLLEEILWEIWRQLIAAHAIQCGIAVEGGTRERGARCWSRHVAHRSCPHHTPPRQQLVHSLGSIVSWAMFPRLRRHPRLLSDSALTTSRGQGMVD